VSRVLVVDDEPLARKALRVRLEAAADVTIVGEAADGGTAVEAIRHHRPDLVYLDIQMPGGDGFEVLEKVAGTHLPMVVFVTAHDAHVLRAFDVHALDYLLKPFSEARFRQSLQRARVELERDAAYPERARLASLLEDLARVRGEGASGPAYPRRLAVREADRIVLLKAGEIDAVEAAGNYVTLVARGRKYLLRQTLAELERQLDPRSFARIHRSTIVNVERVVELRTDPHGDGDVILEGGAAYRYSRVHRERLLAGLGGSPR
jgi:two-component system LytT family response regulator